MLAGLLATAGAPLTAGDDVALTGRDPALPCNFLLGAGITAAIAAGGVAAARLWALRTGRRQRGSLDMRPATAALRADRYLLVNGKPPPSVWAGVSGIYRTRDGRWVQLHCNFPHHRAGTLRVLACPEDPAAVAQAVATWDGQALEDALAAEGLCPGLVRSPQEWLAHPHGAAVAQLPVLEVLRIGDSRPEPLPSGDRPLSGVRVLDLTRVIAGPVGGRTLAEHGADVLRIRAAHLHDADGLVIDTGHGKLSANLDLREPADVERLQALTQQADVLVQSYRPGALAGRGFSPEAVAALRPGIVYATLSAYGHQGPWRDRRGFDTLVQSVSGLVHEHSGNDLPPHHLPAQPLDYVSGYLLAFGVMTALTRRAQQGGSYLVRVSLAQTSRWLSDLGRVDGEARGGPDLPAAAIADLMTERDTAFGRLRYVAPVVQMSETPPRWDRPSTPLGSHPPEWPPRG